MMVILLRRGACISDEESTETNSLGAPNLLEQRKIGLRKSDRREVRRGRVLSRNKSVRLLQPVVAFVTSKDGPLPAL